MCMSCNWVFVGSTSDCCKNKPYETDVVKIVCPNCHCEVTKYKVKRVLRK